MKMKVRLLSERSARNRGGSAARVEPRSVKFLREGFLPFFFFLFLVWGFFVGLGGFVCLFVCFAMTSVVRSGPALLRDEPTQPRSAAQGLLASPAGGRPGALPPGAGAAAGGGWGAAAASGDRDRARALRASAERSEPSSGCGGVRGRGGGTRGVRLQPECSGSRGGP